jgi:pimeloyl-ACP methyl ester carboxylesterase
MQCTDICQLQQGTHSSFFKIIIMVTSRNIINAFLSFTIFVILPNSHSILPLFLITNSQILPYFSSFNHAFDLNTLIKVANPTSVFVYAVSYGTWVANIFLQLPEVRVDGVILDGTLDPTSFTFEDYGAWVERITFDLLKLCATSSSFCADKLDITGQMPGVWMADIIAKQLPCLQRLSWLNQTTAAQFTALLMTSESMRVLIAPFWARLGRCSNSDVAQLNLAWTLIAAHLNAVSKQNSYF